jgi:hypothetical protein
MRYCSLIFVAFAVFCFAHTLCVAEEIETAPWGSIKAQANGQYVFEVRELPADGRLAVPKSFPQIVSAELRGGAGAQPIDIAYNEDASQVALLLPVKDKPKSGDIHVKTSDKTQQFPDGRIIFCAREAKVVGTKAKLEEHPGNYRIGFWSDASDYVTWDYAATRWGKYNVKLAYSTASPDGAEIEVQLGDAKASGTLKSTGDWYRYTTIDLGDVYVNEGKQALSVKCVKPAGGAVMNLKAVILTPACEGAAPVQADDGTVTLHSRDSIVHGVTLRYEPAEKKQTLGYWVKKDDGASWNFTLNTPGVYDVEVLQGCGTGQGGSTVVVRSGDGEPLEFVVEDTGHFQNFKPRIIGQVKFNAAGQYELFVQPKTIAKAAACDIRQIKLWPVRQP